ncbi:MAG: S-layer family protein [Pseudanabaenales cyanobacterium]|nr:S-layer family protein [Pseudanabaenales cyanobacterium]
MSCSSSKNILLLPLALYPITQLPLSASAQIVPDGSLPNNSVVIPNGAATEITGGVTAGDTLFHSFEQFSVPTGVVASFGNALTIENIISRVTGGSISYIDGEIQANGTANLFLLNPHGIVFGPDASLNIGGSFVGSTANSIQFSDGSEFSASNPQAPPLLTVSVPVGLQFGATAGKITVQGAGNNLFLNRPDQSVNRRLRPSGLQVDSGQTLALVGGDIALEGGNLTAAGGRLELGSVGAGTVTLTPTNPGWTLGYETTHSFRDIQLSRAASLEASGDSGGSIQVQGRRVSISEASAMLADTLGDGSGGTLTIRATDAVQVIGFSFPPLGPLFPSRLSTDSAPGATGQGGHLAIETGRLLVADGAQISNGAFSSADAGILSVTAEETEVIGGSPFGPSGLFAPVAPGATGNGGDVIIATERLRISDGAQIFAITVGSGDAGALTVRANQVELMGVSPGGAPSGLFTNVERGAAGDGGDLVVVTERLRITDGAQIGAITRGAGDAGALSIRATEVELMGGAVSGPSGLFTTVVSGASGAGGDLTIDTARLRVTEGAQAATSTIGGGDAGDLVVRASESVDLIGVSAGGRSGLFSSALVGTGDGGNLTVVTDQLGVRDGATISVSNFSSRNPSTPPGQGGAGDLTIKADSILLDNEGILTAEAAVGDRGNIDLQSDTAVVLRRGSAITTNARGTATGGNIIIDTDILIALENSDITANAAQSFGGRVIVNAQSIFGAEFREQLTPESDITASSALGAEFSGIVELNTPDVDPSRGLTELPENLTDSGAQIAAVCTTTGQNEFTITGRGGLPQAPDETLRDWTVWEDLRLVREGERGRGGEEERGRGGEGEREHREAVTSVVSSAMSPQFSNSTPGTPIVEARGWVVSPNGQVRLVAQVPEFTSSQSWFRSPQCAADLVE